MSSGLGYCYGNVGVVEIGKAVSLTFLYLCIFYLAFPCWHSIGSELQYNINFALDLAMVPNIMQIKNESHGDPDGKALHGISQTEL